MTKLFKSKRKGTIVEPTDKERVEIFNEMFKAMTERLSSEASILTVQDLLVGFILTQCYIIDDTLEIDSTLDDIITILKMAKENKVKEDEGQTTDSKTEDSAD